MSIKSVKAAEKGFTLIELLIVIAVVAILATVVFVALNPVARFEDARNSRRWSDVNALLSAIKLSQVDKRGYIDAIRDMVPGTYYQIGIADQGCNITCSYPDTSLDAVCVNLNSLSVDGYLPSIPTDPNATGADINMSHYYIYKNDTGTITIGSCNEEPGSAGTSPVIEVSR